MALGQVSTEEKSNEITAIPELIDQIDPKGAIVSIDTMGCQKTIVKKIIDAKGDFVLAKIPCGFPLKNQWPGIKAAKQYIHAYLADNLRHHIAAKAAWRRCSLCLVGVYWLICYGTTLGQCPVGVANCSKA